MSKIEELKSKLSEIKEFRHKLGEDNVVKFENLKDEINDLLNENLRIKFNRLRFYEEYKEDVLNDDLPF
jgi:DNA repair exonuclease SbcCD ATPase subunit